MLDTVEISCPLFSAFLSLTLESGSEFFTVKFNYCQRETAPQQCWRRERSEKDNQSSSDVGEGSIGQRTIVLQ